jgi:hypothetical protein
MTALATLVAGAALGGLFFGAAVGIWAYRLGHRRGRESVGRLVVPDQWPARFPRARA